MSSGRDLQVELVDDQIIITLPGTSYRVTYYDEGRVPRSRLEACQRQGARAAFWRGDLSRPSSLPSALVQDLSRAG
jgi:hypothetical protein